MRNGENVALIKRGLKCSKVKYLNINTRRTRKNIVLSLRFKGWKKQAAEYDTQVSDVKCSSGKL